MVVLTVIYHRTMGTYAGDVNADLEYPYTFIKSMGALLHAGPPRTPFRYIQLSGKFVRQDQDTNLWWGSKPRKIKVKVLRSKIP